MLVYQGAAAFELWTGLKAPIAVMLGAAEGRIGGGAHVEVALEKAAIWPHHCNTGGALRG